MRTITLLPLCLALASLPTTAWCAPLPKECGPGVVVHWSPAEDLERLDVELLTWATRAIDMAAYELTDFAVIEALKGRAGKGVHVRLYLDRTEYASALSHPATAQRLRDLAATAGVEMKLKGPKVLMHLKAYAVDGAIARRGSANFSPSGLKQEDNDLEIECRPEAAAAFSEVFERLWARPANRIPPVETVPAKP